MKATKDWGPCSCDCGKNISSGCEIVMLDGAMYLSGHQNNRRTRQMAAIPVEPAPAKKKKKS
jgi:hypothetical protein